MPQADLVVQELLASRAPEVSRFFERAERDSAAPMDIGFRALFASVPRRLGRAAQLELGANVAALPAARPHWTIADGARLWLILRGLPALPESEQPRWVLGLFEAGEIGEQVSLLRTLAALPVPARFVETGEQACRHNSLDVFEAIVSHNAFLAAYFPPLSFNQAVMKAIFLGVPIARIEGLEPRTTPELARMAASYVSERLAAGRAVPPDAAHLSRYGA